MDMLLQFFVVGFAWGASGICLLVCGGTLLPYTTATKNHWREGVRDLHAFLMGKVAAYVVFGFVASLLGVTARAYFGPEQLFLMKGIAGAFIMMLGLLIFSGRLKQANICRFIHLRFPDKNSKIPLVLGAAVGTVLCAPFLAVLTAIATSATSLFWGTLLALSFGIGANIPTFAFLSPLVIFCTTLPKKIFPGVQTSFFYRSVCALWLVYLGWRVIHTPLLGLSGSVLF